jgi:hypothetical protein
MLRTDAAVLLTGPLVQKRFYFILHGMRVFLACDVQVHIAIANMSIPNTPDNIRAKPFFHDLDTTCNVAKKVA